MNEIICLLVMIGALCVVGPLAYVCVWHGSDIMKSIRGTIKWNIDKFKK